MKMKMKMKTQSKSVLHYQNGFSLLEVFIALAIGLVIFAGVLSIFVGMRTTTSETTSYGELQENGRFAISVLSDDLLRQDFWGDYTSPIDSITPAPGAPAGECVGDGINNGTFPLAAGHFRTLWGQTVTSASIMRGCRTDAKIGSDILQLKRVISSNLIQRDGAGNPILDVDGNEMPIIVTPAENFYFVSNANDGTIFAAGAVPVINDARVWQYQHHIYYVREEAQGGNTVPVLMQGQLSNTLNFSPIIDGIEMIRFEYGIDAQTDPANPGYGIIDAFVSADNMTDPLWNNATSRILSVKIYVLARNVLPDNKYTNNNSYQLGDQVYTFNDNYRRLLFSSTVTLYNAGVDVW